MKFSILIPGLFAVMVQSVLAQTTVTTTADSGPGSLREALVWANANPGLDTIDFAIPGTGPFTIQLLSPLPAITDPVEIDGYTQFGATRNALQVELDGS